MKRDEILPLLPGVFQRWALPGTPLVALLDVMEALHEPAERIIAGLDAVFDPRRTPEGFVPQLARWVDLERILPVTAGTDALREVVGIAYELAQRRGTAGGLLLFLETATQIAGFEVDEHVPGPDGEPRPFHVRVRAPHDALAHRALVERIIAGEKPVHVTCELEFVPAAERA